MASGAAPLYLPAYTFGGKTYQDGGLFENNPVSAAITVAKRKNPLATRAVVLSLSTGKPKYGFDGLSVGNPQITALHTIKTIYDITSAGQVEGAHLDLRLRSDATLEQLHYYQFENPFTEDTNFELDMSEDSFFSTLDSLTDATYAAQQSAIIDIYNRLVA
jgi:patatin-like phospholipase/acyl hydrolase